MTRQLRVFAIPRVSLAVRVGVGDSPVQIKERAVLRRVRVVRAGERLKAIATTYLDQEAPLR